MTDGDAGRHLEGERMRMLSAEAARRFGRPALCLVRAPGRVNLLGEHTDYNGLPVLPMAIDRSVLIAVAPRRDLTVNLHNTSPRFPRRRYRLGDTIPPYPAGDWGNYCKAAAQGLMRHCGAQLYRGADLLIDGDIPSGAGLSSSSALVVASALALLAANSLTVAHPTLAELLPTAERYVGTLSGGMDQAVSLLATAGHALRIDFSPLRVRPVPLPPGHSIVVCHSLVRAEKSGAARRAYNQRVIECRLACGVLERVLGAAPPHGLRTLGELSVIFPGRALLDLVWQLAARVPDRPLRLAEIAAATGTTASRLRQECAIPPELSDSFSLLRRVRHVIAEAERVNRAEEMLGAGQAPAFGRLMDASHSSCRDDYEVSCPELEQLVQVAKEAGALGARLTGAGFGGCTVNLVAAAEVDSFLARVDRRFYSSRSLPAGGVGECRFVFTARGGAEVVRV